MNTGPNGIALNQSCNSLDLLGLTLASDIQIVLRLPIRFLWIPIVMSKVVNINNKVDNRLY